MLNPGNFTSSLGHIRYVSVLCTNSPHRLAVVSSYIVTPVTNTLNISPVNYSFLTSIQCTLNLNTGFSRAFLNLICLNLSCSWVLDVNAQLVSSLWSCRSVVPWYLMKYNTWLPTFHLPVDFITYSLSDLSSYKLFVIRSSTVLTAIWILSILLVSACLQQFRGEIISDSSNQPKFGGSYIICITVNPVFLVWVECGGVGGGCVGGWVGGGGGEDNGHGLAHADRQFAEECNLLWSWIIACRFGTSHLLSAQPTGTHDQNVSMTLH